MMLSGIVSPNEPPIFKTFLLNIVGILSYILGWLFLNLSVYKHDYNFNYKSKIKIRRIY